MDPLQIFSCYKSLLTLKAHILSHQCVSSDVLLNSAAVKNSFHTKSMNVVSPLNELSGDSSGLKPTNILKLKLLVLKMNFVHGDFR